MDNEYTDRYLGMLLEGRYELLECIGSGGMAVVYRAMDNRLNRYVAVKIMRQEFADNVKFRQRFQTESHAIAKLNHPNVVNVFDVSHTDNVEYIVMELVNGQTLKQYMRTKKRLGVRETLNFHPDCQRPLPRPCQRDRSPGYQATEHPSTGGRHHQGCGFRYRGSSVRASRCGERGHRLGALYISRAGPGAAGGRQE